MVLRRRRLLLLHLWLHHWLAWLSRGIHLLLVKVLRWLMLWWGHHVLRRQSPSHARHVEVVGTGHRGHGWLDGLLMLLLLLLLLRSRRRSLLWWQLLLLLLLLHVRMWRLVWGIAGVAR